MLKSTLKLRSLPSIWRKSPFLAAPSSISSLNTVPNPYKTLHESFPKYYFNNGAFQGHGQNQAGSPHKPSIAGPFNEKSFMVHFLHLAQHRGGHSKEEYVETFKVLRANVDKLQNPSSVVGLIHKLQMFHEYIDDELRNKILDQATKVFLRQYSANDQGDLLRAVILVAAVQKINHDKFYKTLFSIVLAKLENISFFNLLTILESYTYNKRLFQAGSVDEVTKILKCLSNYLQIRELGNFSKYSTLLSYLARTVQYLGPNAKDSEAIKAEILKNVNKLYDVILQMIVNDRGSKSMDIFGLTDVFISLDAFNPIYPNLKEKYGLLQRHYGSLIELYLPKGFQLSNVKYNLGTVIPFLKRHYVAPPSYVHPQFASLINQIFLKHSQDKDREFHNLETYVYFLLFLAKTDSLNIPEAIAKGMKLEELIIQERNLFYLAKALEFFALCEQAGKNYFSPEKTEIDRLEKAIFHIIGRLPKKGIVSPSLLQIFQLLVALNKGSNEDWKNLLTLFSDKENLKNLDHLEFIIKLVPAGAVKTKNLYKVYSNISITGAAHRLKGAQPDPEVAQLLEKFWNTVEEILVNRANEIYPDKYPIILFNFVYANLIKDTYKKVYKIAKPKLINNLHLLSPKQLSEIIYSYSRVEEEADELMFAVAREVLSKKLYEQMDSTALSNLYWGYTNAGIWVEELSRKLEERIFANLKDMPMETFIQFCYALARNNRQLEASEQEKLNSYTLKVLKEYSGPSKSFNIQNVIGICSSFNVLRNYDAKVWEEIINFLLQKKYFYQDSILLLYYIYVLYIHLTVEKLPITNRGDLFQVIQDNHRNIMEHMIANKKQQRSLFETQIRDIISHNMTELFGSDAQFKQDDEPLMLYRGPEHDFILVNDMGKVKDLIKQKKLTRLGVRELLIPYTVDIIVNNYAIEVNGPSHYMKAEDKSIKEHGYSSMKANFLKKLGMTYIEIPYFINDELDPENEKRIIKSIKDQIEKSKKEN